MYYVTAHVQVRIDGEVIAKSVMCPIKGAQGWHNVVHNTARHFETAMSRGVKGECRSAIRCDVCYDRISTRLHGNVNKSDD